MNLKMEPFMSRLFRGAAVALLIVVASGCGAPLEDEVSAENAVELATTVQAERIPTQCQLDHQEEMAACQNDCGNQYSECMGECSNPESEPDPLCDRRCSNLWIYCLERCDTLFC